jgi:hypothetical protein
VTKWLAEAALALYLSGSLLACASPGPPPISAPSAAPQNIQPALVTADTADVRVTNADSPVAMRVGQTLGLKPFRAGQWQVSFSNEALQLITPLDRLPSPGDDGWVWKALAPGETNITFTSVAPPSGAPPCPPNVFRITLTVNITAS